MTKTTLQVYNGQILIGEIEDGGRNKVAAFKIGGTRRIKVGVFATRILAMRALSGDREGLDHP
jgi:hypothetical protein